ncbi:MAG: ATP-binding protein, partial [Myxococcota bacterium]
MGGAPDEALLRASAQASRGIALYFEGRRCLCAHAHPDLKLHSSLLEGDGFWFGLDGRGRLALEGGEAEVSLELRIEGRSLYLEGYRTPPESDGWSLVASCEDAATASQRWLEFISASLGRAQTPISVVRGEAPYNLLYANPAFEAATGYLFSEVQGQSLQRLLGKGEDPSRVLQRALEEREGGQVDLKTVTARGRGYVCRLTLVPVWGRRTDRPELFMGLQREVSAEHDAAEALERERSLLAEAEAVAKCGTWQWDAASGEVRWSPGTYRIWGIDPGQAPPSFEQQAQGFGEDFPALVGAVQKAMETGESYALDLRLTPHPHTDPESRFWTHARGHRVVSPSGQIRLIGTLQDIDDRKAQERALEEHVGALARALGRAEKADRAKSAFLANMSHEIRTPMNGVIGAASLLEGAGLDLEARELVRTIRSSGEVLLGLINDILDVSKIEAGQLELDTHLFDVEDVIDDVFQLVAERAREHGNQLILSYDPKAGECVVGDSARVRQILVNLVGNAVKFTRDGEVRVEVTRCATARLAVEVRDTGIGISPDSLERLFEPFSQAESSTTRRFGGTGLGLTISQNLARLMGGGVSVDSELGVGSCFRLEVPFERIEGRARGEALAGCAVWVQDENDQRRHGLCRVLVGESARLEAVGSPGAVGIEVSTSADGRIRLYAGAPASSPRRPLELSL